MKGAKNKRDRQGGKLRMLRYIGANIRCREDCPEREACRKRMAVDGDVPETPCRMIMAQLGRLVARDTEREFVIRNERSGRTVQAFAVCPSCGEYIDVEARFCRKCGQKIKV